MICNNCKRDKGDVTICPYCHVGNVKPFQPHHLPPGTVIGGRYVLKSILGEGGFGITYLANDSKLDKTVAVKEYFPHGLSYRNTTAENSGEVIVTNHNDIFEHGKERFLSEAKTLAKFSGEAGIVNVTDYLEENHTAYLVMEYLDGDTLRDYLKSRDTMTAENAFAKLMPVINVLERIHKSGVIHRDISPDNIMIVRNGDVKLMDFGSAKEYIDNERSMSVLLKAGYAPEEQYRKHSDQGPWTDVYALCATVYRCVTGKVPVDALNRLVNDTLQRPSQMGIAISPALENVLMYGLAVRKQDRCQSMTELKRLIAEAARPLSGASKSAVPKQKEDMYATVPANSFVTQQKKQQPPKEAAHAAKDAQAPMKRVAVQSSAPSKQPEFQSASYHKAPAAKSKDKDPRLKKKIDVIEIWSSILVVIGVVCAYFIFFNYHSYWWNNYTIGGSIALAITVIVAIALPVLIYRNFNKPKEQMNFPLLIVLLVILSLLSIGLINTTISMAKDSKNDTSSSQASSSQVSSDQSSAKINVKESDSNAKLFQSTVDYLFSYVDDSHYEFPSNYTEGQTYRQFGKYYTTDLSYSRETSYDLSPSIVVGSMTVTMNKTTLGDMKSSGWRLKEGETLETNSYQSQHVQVENGDKRITLWFEVTADDIDQAKITGLSIYTRGFSSAGGDFRYQSITTRSSIQDVVDQLGEPSDLHIFHDDIETKYTSDDSAINVTVSYEYSKDTKTAAINEFYVRYRK